MIGKIQQGTQRAAQEMQAGVARIADGVQLARQAGESVVSIRDASGMVTRTVDEISMAIKEQAQAARGIAQQVVQIARGAEENHASVGRTAASAGGLQVLAQELDTLAGRFRIA